MQWIGMQCVLHLTRGNPCHKAILQLGLRQVLQDFHALDNDGRQRRIPCFPAVPEDSVVRNGQTKTAWSGGIIEIYS